MALDSSFTGKWGGHGQSQRIEFTKVYQYDGHSVEYRGKIDGAGGIKGTWSVVNAPTPLSGSFTLTGVRLE
jgi:hypothetical protein